MSTEKVLDDKFLRRQTTGLIASVLFHSGANLAYVGVCVCTCVRACVCVCVCVALHEKMLSGQMLPGIVKVCLL